MKCKVRWSSSTYKLTRGDCFVSDVNNKISTQTTKTLIKKTNFPRQNKVSAKLRNCLKRHFWEVHRNDVPCATEYLKSSFRKHQKWWHEATNMCGKQCMSPKHSFAVRSLCETFRSFPVLQPLSFIAYTHIQQRCTNVYKRTWVITFLFQNSFNTLTVKVTIGAVRTLILLSFWWKTEGFSSTKLTS